ncbi:alpha/beta hydrolase [Allobacillus sp. GCM10007491]|uniref:Alpha/beta hydrolase n=1 Tax=Allobacillus saliphilus TaxID=2912308 RepID=A0A941CVP3_9BACI|nr:alpha/beta hydrolase [Allobacillus saliphilus]MBR7554852.1 alpha/beta hydrolase [Allobacillus saliphilus]
MNKYIFLGLLLIVCVGCSNNESSKEVPEITGDWFGAIETPNTLLPIEVTFDKDERLTGTINIPAQNIQDFNLSNLKYQDDELSFDMNIPGQVIRFKSKEVDEELIEGEFHQQGATFPFYLERSTEGESSTEDTASEIVSVETNHGKLSGELLLPEKETDTVALIIPGSGPTDRNGNSAAGTNNSLKMLAELLREESIASLRYDKRGAGLNQEAIINEEDLSFDDFIDDAVFWLEKLRADDRFERLIVIGHSQGSLVGMTAAQQVEVDALISLAGAGRPLNQVLQEQLSAQLDGELLAEAKQIIEQLQEGRPVDDVSQPLQSTFRKSVQPFLISWMDYDPTTEISQLRIPILIINGTTDLQVSVEDAEMLHAEALNSELKIIDGMNHVLKIAPEERSENLKTYNQPTLPLAEELKESIKVFLGKLDHH